MLACSVGHQSIINPPNCAIHLRERYSIQGAIIYKIVVFNSRSSSIILQIIKSSSMLCVLVYTILLHKKHRN